MYPDLFGISGFSMTLMIIIGALSALVLIGLYLKHEKVDSKIYIDLAITVIFTIIIGIIGTILFENTYEAIKHAINGEPQKWTWAMTFYGGLIFGVAGFLIIYRLFYLKHNPPVIKKILVIAPAAISLGHAFGRIGCLLSGCCYGKETDSVIGILLPGHHHKTIPTQIIEMVFLFFLAGVLIFLSFKDITTYTFPIYMVGYGVFRFVLEFFRGDERGQLPGLSPSQYICIVMVLGAGILIYFYKTKIFKKEEENYAA